MRTEDQVRRKMNEFLMQRRALEERLAAASEAERPALQTQLEHLDDKAMLLEWVLNQPIGSYHG